VAGGLLIVLVLTDGSPKAGPVRLVLGTLPAPFFAARGGRPVGEKMVTHNYTWGRGLKDGCHLGVGRVWTCTHRCKCMCVYECATGCAIMYSRVLVCIYPAR
jgi:hypothetical protein